MPIPLHSSSLLDLQNPAIDITLQIAALKQIKNEIIGHEQKKEALIRQGLVDALADALQRGEVKDRRRGQSSAVKGHTGDVVNGNGSAATGDEQEREGNDGGIESYWMAEDELRLQATLVVGSLAMGGPPLLSPLFAGAIHNHLVTALSPYEFPPRIILATLTTLNTMVDASTLHGPCYTGSHSLETLIPNLLLTDTHMLGLKQILLTHSSSADQNEHLRLAARLIASTCREDSHKAALVRGGIPELLAARLAAMIVSMGYMLPSADPSIRKYLPSAPPKACLSQLLDAIEAIVRLSRYEAARFLYSPAILGVFPIITQEYQQDSTPFSQILLNQHYLNPVEELLPRIQMPRATMENNWSKAFPALGAFTDPSDFPRMPNPSTSELASLAMADTNAPADDTESPMCAWLLHMMRTERGANRLSAASLLTTLFRARLLHKTRDRQLAFLMVPLLVQMIDEAVPNAKSGVRVPSRTDPLPDDLQRTKEQAPAVLSLAIKDSPPLQASAVDASVIKKLCQVLKRSFDPVPNLPRPMWSPAPGMNGESLADVPNSRTVGPPGIQPKVQHALRCRAGALLALAAVAQKEDSYRKAIIENGVINCVVDSLAPYNIDGLSGARLEESLSNPKAGNPSEVIIAACWCARAISRSVSILRTSLIDAGIAKPIFSLLANPDVEIKVAATDVLCNLLLEFSPMRKDLIEAGALETLCDHAHSANPRLRLLSLWALKHLVLSATNDIKIKCLEELGTGWLVQIISNEPGTGLNPIQAPISMGTPNAAGERVDLLNAVDEPMTTGDQAGEDNGNASAEKIFQRSPLPYTRLPSKLRVQLETLKRMENIPPSTLALMDEVKIQEQGLEYIQNLTTGSGSAEMIDHLFSLIGSSRLLEILASKLKARTGPRTSHIIPSALTPSFSSPFNPNPYPQQPQTLPPDTPSFSLAAAAAAAAPHRPPHRLTDFPHAPEIVLSAILTLVHIAAGTPRHRRLLLSLASPAFPKGVVAELLPHFDSGDRRIRVACVWVVSNLSWTEDQSDWKAARVRAEDLRALGIAPPLMGVGMGMGSGAGAGAGNGRGSGAVGGVGVGQAQGQGLGLGLGLGQVADGGVLARLLNDPDLDVRERTKTAVEQLSKLLNGNGGGGGGGGAAGGNGGGGAMAGAGAGGNVSGR